MAKDRRLTAAMSYENENVVNAVGGIEWVADQLAAGHRVVEIARRLGVSYFWLYQWLSSSPARATVIMAARAAAAEVKVFEAEAIADNLAGVGMIGAGASAEVAAAKLRAELRWKLAGKLDPDRFADKKEASNTLNINHLHLEAVRAVNASPPARAVLADPNAEPDFETIPGQETGTTEAEVVVAQQVSAGDTLLHQQGGV